MIKIFFITFFILEVIVATAIIFKLHKLDKIVLNTEKNISSKQNDLRAFFYEIKTGLENSNKTINSIKQLINRKREEIARGLLRQLLIFLGVFILKDKYKKKFLIINIMFDIYTELKNEMKSEFA